MTQEFSLAAILATEWKAEVAKTRRTLERLPADQNDFRPDPKSRSLLELANHIATVSGLAGTILNSDGVELGGPNDPRTIVREQNVADVLGQFHVLAEKSLARVESTTEEEFLRPWQASQNGNVLFAGTRYGAYRNISVNHLIHHRAQLAMYLRMLNVPVPALFGPSADEGPVR